MLPSTTVTISDTAAHVALGVFAIDCVTDVVFSAVTGRFTGWSGVTYPAGKLIFVNDMRSLTLTSGTATLYFR